MRDFRACRVKFTPRGLLCSSALRLLNSNLNVFMFFFPNVFILALKSVDASILMAKELLMLSGLIKFTI